MTIKVISTFVLLFAVQSQCQYYSGIGGHLNIPDFSNFYNWRAHAGPGSLWPLGARAPEGRDVEQVTERDREPLAPDYKDPEVTKPQKPPQPTQEPNGYFGGGVVDVDASNGGFPAQFPSGFPEDPNFPAYPGGAHYPGGFFNIFGLASQRKPWWKGPNVCIEREESTDDDESQEKKNETEIAEPNIFSTSIRLSNCHETPYKYECVTKINNHGIFKTFTVRYKCCYGFARTENSQICNEIDLKSLLDTFENVKVVEFRNLIRSTDLEDKFTNENMTAFVPSDEALAEFTDNMLEMNQVEAANFPADAPEVRRRRDVMRNAVSSKDLVLNHVTQGFIDTRDLINEQLLHSENNNSTIRINIYPTESYEKLMTANCARIRKSNNLATNGIVHVIDGVLTPVMQNIQDLIRDSNQLSHFAKLLENTEFVDMLGNENKHLTIFAPTDEAFNKLDAVTRDRLLRGDSCASSIIRHHVVAHSICSVAITGNATTHNMEGTVLNLERTEDDQVIVENLAKIVKSDILATNGVIHLIDTILLPDSAMYISQALKRENLTKFRELIEEAGLSEDFDNLSNATIFAPTDEALEEPETAKMLEEIKGDKDKMKEVLMYHTVQGQLQSCDMNNNALLDTKDEINSLRLNLYSTLPVFTNIVNRATVNCARLVNFDEKSCGSVIHEVNKLLLPPQQSIMEVIETDEKYSILMKLIKDTEIEEILKDGNQSLTLLAPTNEALSKMDENVLNNLLEDKTKAYNVLKNHVITEILCCAGIGPQSWAFNSLVPTMSNQPMQVSRGANHHIRVGSATVSSCDKMATNGVIHTINKVLIPEHRKPQLSEFGGFFFFNL